ncbi:MAG TPA: phage tail protein [Chloroflexia bacterium]|jgi:phage tail-like protein
MTVSGNWKSYRDGNTGTSKITDTLVTFHFYVEGQGSPDVLSQAVFTEVSGLEIEIEVTPVEEGGANNYVHKLPGRTKVSDITLKNGISNSNDLWLWFKRVLGGKFERKHVSIVMVNQAGEQKARWEYHEAMPIKWVGPQLKADQSALAIQTLVLTHRGLISSNP